MKHGLRRLWLCAAALVAGVGGAFAAPAAATDAGAEEVLWYLAHFPPSSIQNGPQAGRGYLDRMLRELVWPALPDYRHRIVTAPPSRLAQDAANFPNVCTPSMTKTPERAQSYHMSMALFRFLPAGLAVRRTEVEQLGPWTTPTGELDLERWLAGSTASLGVVGTRRHGSAVDRILAQHPDRLLVLNTTQANTTLLRMLALNRSVDASLSYGFEIPFLTSQYPELTGQLAWFPVRGQPHSLTNHAACSRSGLGQRVITALNQALQRGALREHSQGLFEEWLDTDGRRTLQRLR
jgi:uncharacterized protein (TIGR02285 family)